MASVATASTSICGIDVGTENCYIAVARQGGIEILLNEYSQRSTPAYVGFGGNQRELGVSAKQKQMMNLANTCVAPTLIIGKKFNELNQNDIPYNVQEGENGEPVIPVHHNDVDLVLTPTQVLAMLFTKLRHIAGNVVDCVINCPNYFNEAQKRSLIDAAQIAGLNPLKVIPDMTAIALYYGFYRSSAASGQDFSVVTFVDCGHTSTQVSLVLFNHKENTMQVLDAEYQQNVGGKDFDDILAQYFIEQKNLRLNKRARSRLIAECEKLKKQMSANSNELPINIECLYEDRDFSARIDRAKFEELATEQFDKIKGMLTLALLRATDKYNRDLSEKFGPFKVDSVEIVGGTSRIPAIKRMIKDIFMVEPSTTLNADEAVARGCALQCAILSPTFKVAKELSILDSVPYQINFRYSYGSEFKTVNGLYPRGHQYPFTKQISLICPALPVTAAFDYINDDNEIINYAEFQIREKAGTNASAHIVKTPIKLRVRVDKNGLVLIPSATVSHEIEVEVEVVETKSEESTPMDVDTPNENNAEGNVGEQKQQEQPPQQNAAEEPKKKMKPKTVTIELEVIPINVAGKLAADKLQQFLEIESNLILADKNWKEKTDAKNALEEFIYEWRDRLESGSYDEFIQGNEKADFRAKLEENEQWLNQQDEEEVMHSKSVYDERTNGMKTAFSERFLYRKREAEERVREAERAREAERKAAEEAAAAELLKQQQQQQAQENAQNGQQDSPVETQQTGGDQQADAAQNEQTVEPMTS